MDVELYGIETEIHAPEPPVHALVWLAFAVCGFLIILMSGLAAMMVAILVLRSELRPAAVAPAPTESAEHRRQRALDAIRDGDYERAVTLTTEAVREDPAQSEMVALREISIDLQHRTRPGEAVPAATPRERVAAPAPRVRSPSRSTSAPRAAVAERRTDLVVEPRTDPVVEPSVEPRTDPVVERQTDPVVERRTDPVVAPAEPAPSSGPAVVYVYVPGAVKPRVLEETFRSHLRGATVTAFGSFRDFSQALKISPADAVIAPKPVLDALGLPVHLRGRDATGATVQRYLLLGKRTLSPEDLATAVIGTLDLAGRDSSARFVAQVLDLPSIGQVKRVAEASELISLLQFGTADAILLPEKAARELMDDTQMSLTVVEVGSGATLPAVSVLSEGDRARIEEAMSALDDEVNAKVGVASWVP